MMQIAQADSQRENILVFNHEVNHDNSPVFYRNEHKASLSLTHTHTHTHAHKHSFYTVKMSLMFYVNLH